MNKGIVLKINPSSVIVLTAEGEYLKCKKLLSSYAIGEEIQFPNHAVILTKRLTIYIPKLIPVMIASALILMSVVFVNWNKERALAAGYVNFDSRAKVSFILDKQLNVIDIKAQNKQGKKVIEHMKDWEKESLQKVTDHLIVEMEKNEIIQQDEKVTISGSMQKKYKNQQNKLSKELTNIKQNNSHIEVQPSNKKDEQQNGKKDENKQNGLSSHPNKAHANNSIKNQTKNDSKITTKNTNQNGHKNSTNSNGSTSKDLKHDNKKNNVNYRNNYPKERQNSKNRTGNGNKDHSKKKNKHDDKRNKGYRDYHSKKNHRDYKQNNVNYQKHSKNINWDEKGKK